MHPDQLDEAVKPRGRSSPAWGTTFMFSTGVEGKIRRISPLASQDIESQWRKTNPMPEPPLQEVSYGEQMRVEPNYLSPSYQQQLRDWSQRKDMAVGQLVIDYILLRGVQIEIDLDELTRVRQEMLEYFGVELPANDHLAYLRYVAIGGEDDLTRLTQQVLGQSVPQEEAVQQHIDAFQSTV